MKNTDIHNTRKLTGCTQEEFGDLVDKSRTTISCYEDGSRKPDKAMRQLINKIKKSCKEGKFRKIRTVQIEDADGEWSIMTDVREIIETIDYEY